MSDTTIAAGDQANISPMEFITTASGVDMMMSGPLAAAYSQGLNELYSKSADGALALETQALDTGLARRNYLLRKKQLLDTDDKANMSMFYGVQKGYVRTDHVIDVVDALSALSDEKRRRSVVVIDAMIRPRPGQPPMVEYGVNRNPAEVALESYCKSHGVAVFNSFDDFAQQHG